MTLLPLLAHEMRYALLAFPYVERGPKVSTDNATLGEYWISNARGGKGEGKERIFKLSLSDSLTFA